MNFEMADTDVDRAATVFAIPLMTSVFVVAVTAIVSFTAVRPSAVAVVVANTEIVREICLTTCVVEAERTETFLVMALVAVTTDDGRVATTLPHVRIIDVVVVMATFGIVLIACFTTAVVVVAFTLIFRNIDLIARAIVVVVMRATTDLLTFFIHVVVVLSVVDTILFADLTHAVVVFSVVVMGFKARFTTIVVVATFALMNARKTLIAAMIVVVARVVAMTLPARLTSVVVVVNVLAIGFRARLMTVVVETTVVAIVRGTDLMIEVVVVPSTEMGFRARFTKFVVMVDVDAMILPARRTT